MSERVATSPRLDQARARQYRSTAPVELVQCPRISLPLAQPRIRPSATLAAGQVHAGKLKCGLGRGTFHPRWLSGLILQGGQRRLSETSDPEERRVAPSDLDRGRLGGQPVTDHGTPQSFEQATLFSRKDRFQLAALLGVCTVADVQSSRSLAAKEIAWPFRRESDLGSIEINAVRIAALYVETKCATAPALVRRPLRTKPARAQHFTTAELYAPPRKLPTHRRCLPLLIFLLPKVSRERRIAFRASLQNAPGTTGASVTRRRTAHVRRRPVRVKGSKTRSEHIFSELPRIADMVERADSHRAA